MTFSSIYIKIPYPLNLRSSCFTIIESHFTVYDVIQKALNQVYHDLNLNPNEYGIYILPHGKWLFPKCKLSDYINYISPMQIEQFQLRPKKLASITVTCLQYKTSILCDPNQTIGSLSKRAAEIFGKKENNSNSSGSSQGIRKSHSHIQNLTLVKDSQSAFSIFSQDDQSDSFFDWNNWSIWYKHRFVPDDTPCSMLNFCEVQMRRETNIQTNVFALFKRPLRETLLHEQNLEKKERREKKEHRKEKKHSKLAETPDASPEKRSNEAPVEIKKKFQMKTLELKSLGPLNLSMVSSNTQKSPRSGRSPRSPRSSRSGHSSRHDSGDKLDSFFDNIEKKIPVFLEYIFQKIESNPKIEGIFRKFGDKSVIDSLIDRIDTMYKSFLSDNESSTNTLTFSSFKEELKTLIDSQQPHDIVGLLKSYFRVLPESVIPRIFFDKIFETASITDSKTRLLSYKCIINSMPAVNYAVLKRLAKCINVIINYSDDNQMNLMNIIICLFPALIKNRTDVDQLTLLSQSKVQTTIGFDIFEKKHAHFLYSRKNKKSVEVPSSTAKCIQKVEGNNQVNVNANYLILRDDIQDKYLISLENNHQAEVPSSCFEREPPVKLSPFSDWTFIEQTDNLDFVYLPIMSKSVNIGVNAEVKYQDNRIENAEKELGDEINELSDILNSLLNNDDCNRDDIKKKLQEMSSIKDYLY